MSKTKYILSFILIILVLLNSSACDRKKGINVKNGEKKVVAFIMRENTGYHWINLKMGANIAAREAAVEISYSTPTNKDDVEELVNMINDAVTKKVKAIIITPIQDDKVVSAIERAYEHKILVIAVDSTISSKKITSLVATDSIVAGKKAGEFLLSIIGTAGNIVIVGNPKSQSNVDLREQGLQSIISGYSNIRVVDRIYTDGNPKELTQKLEDVLMDSSEANRPNCIIALDSYSSEQVAEFIEINGIAKEVRLICFDNTPKEVDYLDKGVIQCLITQNPFSMGYLSVKCAIDSINGKAVKKYIDTDSKLIDTNNMYLPENQKILFPYTK